MPRAALTPREQQVLRSVAAGSSNKEIARELGIGEQAVKALVSRLLLKYGVPSRARLAAMVDSAELAHARTVEMFDAQGHTFTAGQDPSARVGRGERVDEEVTFGPRRDRARLRLDPPK